MSFVRLAFAVLFAPAVAIASGPENLRLAAKGIYVGGLPTSDDQWDALTGLGVRTVVGVDGLPPDSLAAGARAMRVVHIPIGYGGIDAEASASLTRVAREVDRPIYVYCHHGKHRGPAAAAILGRAAGLMDADGADRLLHAAGTSPEYRGLWRDVAAYRPPASNATLPPLVARSEVPPLRLAMTQLDRAWDDYQQATNPIDRDTARTLVREALKESRRAVLSTSDPSTLIDRFNESIVLWSRLEESLRAEEVRRFDQACQSCHETHRQ